MDQVFQFTEKDRINNVLVFALPDLLVLSLDAALLVLGLGLVGRLVVCPCPRVSIRLPVIFLLLLLGDLMLEPTSRGQDADHLLNLISWNIWHLLQ